MKNTAIAEKKEYSAPVVNLVTITERHMLMTSNEGFDEEEGAWSVMPYDPANPLEWLQKSLLGEE